MTIRYSFAIITLLASLALSSALIGGSTGLQNMESGYFCGRNLARVLAALCVEEDVEKRAEGAGTMYNAILAPYYKHQEPQLGLPWLSPHKARGFGLLNKGKRYVVSECCDNACSISELRSYC